MWDCALQPETCRTIFGQPPLNRHNAQNCTFLCSERSAGTSGEVVHVVGHKVLLLVTIELVHEQPQASPVIWASPLLILHPDHDCHPCRDRRLPLRL